MITFPIGDRGMLPVVWDSCAPTDVLKSYVGIYLREEVLMESLVRNLGNFSRFPEAVSFSHGQVLNITNVARECSVQRKSVEGYISILAKPAKPVTCGSLEIPET